MTTSIQESEPEARRLVLSRPPTTKDELWWIVKALWGVKIPRKQICPDHVAPFDAFAEGYFGNDANWVLWYGSRGTGKSLMLALLALTKAAILDINVTLLGGSMAQSQNVHEHVSNLLVYPWAPKWTMDGDPTQTQLKFLAGNWIRPLPASQKTVRGPHPHMTMLDEIDEMEKAIYDAAQGQAMEKENMRGVTIPEMTVASSTWQNPMGTFQEVRDEALEKGMPIRTWCFKEVLKTEQNPYGWMKPEFLERKRRSVPREMFRVEYELGEPAGGSRAFDMTLVEKYFVELPIVWEKHNLNDDIFVFEQPVAGAQYAAGADWGKERDKTVFVVQRIDERPYKTVYFRRVNRQPWPRMITAFNDLCSKYHASGAHDSTGLGNVINDYADERTLKVLFVGRARTELLTEYILAMESGEYRLPRNTSAFVAHKATTVEEIYAPARWNAHLADEVAAFAVAHQAAVRMPPPITGEFIKSDPRPAAAFAGLNTTPSQAMSGGSRVEEIVAHVGRDDGPENGALARW
jgi:hypothetical protein